MMRGAVIVIALGLLAAVSCGGNSEGGNGACNAFTRKLQQCDLATEGRLRCPEGAFAACTFQCFTRTGCSDLRSFSCDATSQIEDFPELERCLVERCATFLLDKVLCANGERIPEAFVCDNEADCFDGSDEEGCPSFTCDDGSEVPLLYECDGEPDCADGSDEPADCARSTCSTVSQ